MNRAEIQDALFQIPATTGPVSDAQSSTFADNLSLPVHRWFRFSAGFSGAWAETLIRDESRKGPVRVFDPFVGSGTTLIAAENAGVQSFGIDPHPFVSRVAKAKLARRSCPERYFDHIKVVRQSAMRRAPHLDGYAPLIHKCYSAPALERLDTLRRAVEHHMDGSPAAILSWLTLVGILRKTSHVGTANCQYILPNKKTRAVDPLVAFDELASIIYEDMCLFAGHKAPAATFLESDARTCAGVPDNFATLVVTSPPYPNNFDYADATRLEMTFLQELASWSDLHDAVRRYLLRSCSQHVPVSAINLDDVLSAPELEPIRAEIGPVCRELASVRETKGGKKTYHLMVACYFLDLAQAWSALRRVCASPCRVCFVVGDSAPYGVYVPVIEWLGKLALGAGFEQFRFERTRDRNVKWKNRKHRVPLCEGRLWVEG